MLTRLQDQRGIAALTVLMVTVVLALAGGVVVFTATAELETGARERRAEDAFVAAEAGLDIAASYIEGNPNLPDKDESDIDGDGNKVEVCLQNDVADPMRTVPCEVTITSPSNGVLTYPATGKPRIDYTVVSVAREGRTVTRTVASQLRAVVRDLPFGMFVDGDVDLNGSPQLLRESLLVTGHVYSREKLNTDGNGDGNPNNDIDLGWRFHAPMISSNPDPDLCGVDPATGQQAGCTAVFANAKIYEKNLVKATNEIHLDVDGGTSVKYPHDRDIHQRRANPNSSTGYDPIVTLPTTSILEAMDDMRRMAHASGTYYNFLDGKGETKILNPADIGATTRDFPKNVVFYIDADAGDTIAWKSSLIPNSTSSDIKYTNNSGQRVGSLSGVIIVRGGKLRFESGMEWTGAVFVPENEFRILGSVKCTCTIASKGFTSQGGGSTIQMVPSWFLNLPAGSVTLLRISFAECEPYQPSAICPAGP